MAYEDTTETPDLTGAPTFFVFAYMSYYPAGGTNDLKSSHHTIEQAREARDEAAKSWDWTEIVQFTAEGLISID